MHYLDNAATTLVPEEVIAAMAEALRHHSGNPSSQYPYGQDGKAVAEAGRAVIAQALGCGKERLFFTSCGTESDVWAIRSAVWHGRHRGKHIITTAVEHSAVLETCKWLETEGYQVTYLKPDKTGMVTAQQVADAPRPWQSLQSGPWPRCRSAAPAPGRRREGGGGKNAASD